MPTDEQTGTASVEIVPSIVVEPLRLNPKEGPAPAPNSDLRLQFLAAG
jgi:hypothetical protein